MLFHFVILDLAVGREPIKFFLRECMSYLGGKGVLRVGNSCYCFTPALYEHVEYNV